MTEFIIFLGVLFVTSMALFAASIVTDRRAKPDALIECLFGLSAVCLWGCIILVYTSVDLLVIRKEESVKLVQSYGHARPPLFEVLMWIIGGWARFFAQMYFTAAGAAGIAWMLATFVPSVDERKYFVGFVVSLCVGVLLVAGFFIFFEGLALILGIIGTIIGILIGMKKLKGRTD